MNNENLDHRQKNGFSPWFIRTCKLVLASLASLTVLTLLLILSLSFPVHAEVWNGICYFLIFLALPTAIAFLLRKKKRIRLFALICVILLLPLALWSYFGRLAHVERVSTKYDIANYLNSDTDFDKNATTVLPTK